LTTLDADTAKALAKCKGSELWLNGLTTLDADTAKALAKCKGSELWLNGLTTLDLDTAKALAEFEGLLFVSDKAKDSLFTNNPFTAATALVWAGVSNGQLTGITAFESRDSVAVAKALATRKGPRVIPNLKKLSPKTLSALIKKEDIEIPLIETLELIPEPDGSPTEAFVLPEAFQKKQQRQRR
jgi:hypothetical protein